MSEQNISKKGKIIELCFGLTLVALAVILRALPHPPNFAPIAALALFGGVYFSKKIGLIVPILAMIISDFFISGFYNFTLMVSVYGSFLLCVALGFWLKKHKRWYTVLGSSLLCSVLFFIITNFAVWLFTSWYTRTLSGLIQCYTMAIPFFRNTLFGDFFYVIAFFGLYEMVDAWIRKRFVISQPLSVSI